MKQLDTVKTYLCAANDLCRADKPPAGYEDQFSPARWAWLMRNKDRNGLEQALVYISNRRFLLSKSAFRAWLESRLGNPFNN
jgi:hypothetical protein